MGFSIESRHDSSCAVTIRCDGELDVGSCHKLIDAVERSYGPELERLRIDFSNVTFIDSTGIGCVIHAQIQCLKQGVQLEVVPGAAMLRLIELTHLGNHLPLTEPVSS